MDSESKIFVGVMLVVSVLGILYGFPALEAQPHFSSSCESLLTVSDALLLTVSDALLLNVSDALLLTVVPDRI